MSSDFDVIASGYGLIEGPRVDAENHLYFSDVLRGGVFRRAPDGYIEQVVPKRRGVGGIALHASGGIVVSGRDICHVRDGESRVLFASPGAGFNDIFTDAEGRIYAGSLRSNPFDPRGGGTPGELWRIDAPGHATELCGGVLLSNGIGFSPDGKQLYHSDSGRREVLVHAVDPDGRLRDSRVFTSFERGVPDGLAVDAEGGVWVACYGVGCVARYGPSGRLDRALQVPASSITSLCFGGEDRRDLYVVTASQPDDPERGAVILRTRSELPGAIVPPARI